MKILKIELQNINSLKSDTPIVINFESEQFKDVGLYAITGSTGAGKTTILDAITIALYHNVPRFNGTKGTLLDVVSHGAHDAFSRVTFSNNNTIYEAQWSIRLASSTGKALQNPQEKVALKNLTTNVIVADQKRSLITEVNNVTQLDYHQFLRSVLLAQGEFAAFLKADRKDKGKLLEQITGEQIYKKIGQGILERKAKEEASLKEIEAKINAEDVLKEEDKEALIIKDKQLDQEIKATENEIKLAQKIVDWYLNYLKLTDESKQHEENAKSIEGFVKKQQPVLAALLLDEKALPFKELITNLNRIEKESSLKSNQLKEIDNALKQLHPQILLLEKQTKEDATNVELTEKDFTKWLPKFDSITHLDTALKNEQNTKEKTVKDLHNIEQTIQEISKEEQKLIIYFEKTTELVKTKENYLKQHQFLRSVALEITDWRTDLASLKTQKASIEKSSQLITDKKEEIVKITKTLQENKELFDQKAVEIKAVETKITSLNTELEKNNLSDLLKQKENDNQTENNWKQFKDFAEQHQKLQKNKADLEIDEKTYLKDLKKTSEQLDTLQKEVENQEKLVADATKILNLERSVAKYEEDRKHLIDGEPCGLCGSKEHPFTEHLIQINVSEAELELSKRQNDLKKRNEEKTLLINKKTVIHTRIESISEQIKVKSTDLSSVAAKVKELPIVCQLTAFDTIETELLSIKNKLKANNERIKAAQQLQIDKDKLSSNHQIQNKAISELKTTIATLEEKNKNAKGIINQEEQSVKELTTLYTTLANNLTTKLSKYKYQLPKLSEVDLFLKEIDENITLFNKTERDLDALNSESKVIKTKIENIKNQFENHAKSKAEFVKIVENSNKKHQKLTAERIAILPIDISVENKRNTLQKFKSDALEKAKLSNEGLQKLLDSKTKQETLQVDNTSSLTRLITEKNELEKTLNTHLKDSDFTSKEEIEKSLLSKEDKEKYTQIKERIRENQLQIKTLKEENAKAFKTLNEAKTFDISEAESKQNLALLKTKKDQLSTQKGELKEVFRKDKEIRDRNQEVYKKIAVQAEICAVWKELFKIIGNSKDAFNDYVQRLTLKQLLDLANVHLYRLNKRYSLKMEETYKPREELNFNLIDHYQTDQSRLVDTSSGGEKFIISLALALGLSDLASKNVKIDSLFIDEGFGTLDGNTLETVISTLETLRSQGKMIGIISHVENLKERIPTQIQITKRSNGISSVAIV